MFQFLQSDSIKTSVSRIILQGVGSLGDKILQRYLLAIETESSSSAVDAGAAVVLGLVAEAAAAAACLVHIRRSDVPERPERRPLWHYGRTGRHTSTALEWCCLGPRLCCSRQCVLLRVSC